MATAIACALRVHPQAPTLPLSILSIISYQLNITVSANVNRLSQVFSMAVSFNCYYVAVQMLHLAVMHENSYRVVVASVM